MQNNLIKINILLEQDEDGYPPFGSENLWVKDLGNDQYQIDNIPFFVRNISEGDILTLKGSEYGLTLDKIVEKSSNTTIRIVFFDEYKNENYINSIRGELTKLNCESEFNGINDLLAVTVPVNVKIESVRLFLDKEASLDRIDYEESSLRQ